VDENVQPKDPAQGLNDELNEGFSDDPREVLEGANFGEEVTDDGKEETSANEETDGQDDGTTGEDGATGDEAKTAEGEEPDSEAKAEEGEEPATEHDERTWTIDGEILTESQLRERLTKNPDFLNRMTQRAIQMPHYQQLYEAAKQQAIEAAQAAQAQAQPQGQQQGIPPQPGIHPADQVLGTLEAYVPVAEQFVSGLAQAKPDDEFVQSLQTQFELAPASVAVDAFLWEQIEALRQVVQGRILPVVQETGQARYQQEAERKLTDVVSSMESEIEELKDPSVRSAILDALREDEIIAAMPPEALLSDGIVPLVQRTVKGLLYDVSPPAKPGSTTARPAKATRKAAGPPAGRRQPPTPQDLRDRLFGGFDEE